MRDIRPDAGQVESCVDRRSHTHHAIALLSEHYVHATCAAELGQHDVITCVDLDELVRERAPWSITRDVGHERVQAELSRAADDVRLPLAATNAERDCHHAKYGCR